MKFKLFPSDSLSLFCIFILIYFIVYVASFSVSCFFQLMARHVTAVIISASINGVVRNVVVLLTTLPCSWLDILVGGLVISLWNYASAILLHLVSHLDLNRRKVVENPNPLLSKVTCSIISVLGGVLSGICLSTLNVLFIAPFPLFEFAGLIASCCFERKVSLCVSWVLLYLSGVAEFCSVLYLKYHCAAVSLVELYVRF